MSPDLTDKPVNSTVPPGLDICLRGFADQNEAQSVGRLVGDGLRLLGQSLNLGGLEGVIVAHDYDEALASIDRGTETSAPLTRTNDDRATGMAMAPAVLRNGVVKHYIVLEANLAKCLIRSPDDQLFHMAVYTLAHEASHVHDVTARDRAYPGVIMRERVPTRKEEILISIADACWAEYAASRLSACFSPEQIKSYEETFCGSLSQARARANACIRSYRRHGNHDQILREVSGEYGSLLKYASYLLGHAAGLQANLGDIAPLSVQTIERENYFKPVFESLRQALEEQWAVYGEWKWPQIYDGLCGVAENLLRIGGLIMTNHAQGTRVDLPFTAATIPSLFG
jgi:hypothetical protein